MPAYFVLIVNVLLEFITNLPTHLHDEDKLACAQNYAKYNDVRYKGNPQSDFDLIRDIQEAVLLKVPFGPEIPAYSPREPTNLLKRGAGLCCDRSRLLDKLFVWAGLETLHVYFLYKPKIFGKYTLPLWLALFMPHSDSHAVTEVKTSKGCLLVDSNDNFISVNRKGNVVDADQIVSYITEFDAIPHYFKVPFWTIRVLYSRHGHLYRPYLPYPQLNWSDFF